MIRKIYEMRLLTLLFLFDTISVGAQLTVTQSSIPDWITQHGYSSTFADSTETSDGYAYLLISKQNNLETKEYYAEYVMKVTSEKGLSIVSTVNEYFEPSFQTLAFHKLNIIRNGKKINKLNPIKFDVIRREEQMERAVYDKSVNAIYNVPDVRVGDVVEYSFTRKGTNPIFNNHRFGTFYLQYGEPVAKFVYKIVYNSQRKIQFKNFGDIGVATVEKGGNLNTTEWNRENVPALLTDDRCPSWFDPYPHIQYSDFQSWNELAQWALDLYRISKLSKGELKEVIDLIRTSGKTEEAKIKECIRIAQGDIRYLSFSDGINGYKPHSPESVFSQKYGDCKDKSFMLATMLNELGFNSHPALVSTDNGYTLNEMLPNPWAFNHCIVQLTYNDSTYWIDPTMDAQVGPLNFYSLPSYHNALVINENLSPLTPIPFGLKNSRLDITEEYSMIEVGGYVKLKVSTIYLGDEADEIRSYFKSNTTDQVNKDYLNFYAKDYMKISTVQDFEYSDDVDKNVISSSEEYLLKDFWKIEGEKKTATVFAGILSSYLKKPETRVRTMPLSIIHPRNIHQTIIIRLPEEFNIEDSSIAIESDAFEYYRSKTYEDKTITLRYEYKTKASFIDAENVDDHIEKISTVLDDNGLTIFKPKYSIPGSSKNPYIAVTIILLVGAYFIRKKFYR